MTRGQNIAMKQPVRLKIANNESQMNQFRWNARLSRTWMMLGGYTDYQHDLIINRPQKFYLDPRNPCREK